MRATALVLLLGCPAIVHAQLEGSAFPRANFKATTVTLSATWGRTNHTSLGSYGKLGGRLDWSSSVGADPPSSESRAFSLTAAADKLFGSDARADGFAAHAGIGYQFRDHSGPWNQPGVRLQTGVTFRQVPALGEAIDQWDVPVVIGVNWMPPLSGFVPAAFVSARGQVRHTTGTASSTKTGLGLTVGLGPRFTTGILHEFGFQLVADGLWLIEQRRELGFSLGLFRIF